MWSIHASILSRPICFQISEKSWEPPVRHELQGSQFAKSPHACYSYHGPAGCSIGPREQGRLILSMSPLRDPTPKVPILYEAVMGSNSRPRGVGFPLSPRISANLPQGKSPASKPLSKRVVRSLESWFSTELSIQLQTELKSISSNVDVTN